MGLLKCRVDAPAQCRRRPLALGHAPRHLLHRDHPENWPAFYGERPTCVFTSRRLATIPGGDVRFASGAVIDVWPEIAAAAGDRDVWVVGGGDLVGQFADAGLLDELRVAIAPVTLTSGRPLLPRFLSSERLRLESVTQNGQFAEPVYTVLHPDRF